MTAERGVGPLEHDTTATGAPAPAADTAQPVANGRPRRSAPLRVGAAVLLLGLAVTAALTVPAEVAYRHNERRLLNLQTNLTASLLGTAPRQIQATLARIVVLSANAQDPVSTFQAAVAPSMAPKGQFSSAGLVLLSAGQPQVLAHVGTASLRSLSGPDAIALYRQAAATTALVTTHVVSGGVQKIGYLLSAPGPGGTYIVGVSQQLPVADRVTVPKGSPDANLDFAIYFGKTTAPSALVARSRSLPSGTVATTTVPFGTSVLTFVASPRGSLAGTWAELLPWGIAVIGVVLSLVAALEARRLVHRRATAETSARSSRELYQRQRAMSETLQRSLLPRVIPTFPGFDIAARYLPGTHDAEVGGDWYSVIEVDDDRFVFVVGDVSGRGIPAAGLMASLRYTIRTLARLAFPPHEILRRANDEINVITDGHFATALVGSVSLSAETVTVASAGHPPPYLITGEGGRFVPVTAGTPLGIELAPAPPVTVPFAHGSTLVVFTDGLIERRNEGLDASLLRLADVASDPAPSADALLEHVVSSLTADGHEDDIAILVIRSLGPPGGGPDGEAVVAPAVADTGA